MIYKLTTHSSTGTEESTVTKEYQSVTHLIRDLLPAWKAEVAAKAGKNFSRVYSTVLGIVDRMAKAIEDEWKKAKS